MAINLIYKRYIKSLLDIVLSIMGIFVLLPLFVVVAVAIKLSSKGPVFYKQVRIGQYFKPFQVLKFRTMVVNADKQGLLITASGDARITPVGRFLRKTKCDELPQLINVIKGDMALVGPRPEVKSYVDLFKKEYEVILRIKPGITDNASIAFINEENLLAQSKNSEKIYIEDIMPKKIVLYKKYIDSISFKNDFFLIFQTVFKIFI